MTITEAIANAVKNSIDLDGVTPTETQIAAATALVERDYADTVKRMMSWSEEDRREPNVKGMANKWLAYSLNNES